MALNEKYVFYYTRKIIKQLFLIRHNHKYKLSKGEKRLIKFVHVEVVHIFLLAGGTVLQE